MRVGFYSLCNFLSYLNPIDWPSPIDEPPPAAAPLYTLLIPKFIPKLLSLLFIGWKCIWPTASPLFQPKNFSPFFLLLWPLIEVSKLYFLLHKKAGGTRKLTSGPTILSLKTIDLFKVFNEIILFFLNFFSLGSICLLVRCHM